MSIYKYVPDSVH